MTMSADGFDVTSGGGMLVAGSGGSPGGVSGTSSPPVGQPEGGLVPGTLSANAHLGGRAH